MSVCMCHVYLCLCVCVMYTCVQCMSAHAKSNKSLLDVSRTCVRSPSDVFLSKNNKSRPNCDTDTLIIHIHVLDAILDVTVMYIIPAD